MKKNLITVFAAAIVGAVAFVGCGDKKPVTPPAPPSKTWMAQECPVTGKKVPESKGGAEDPTDGQFLSTPYQFEHEGMMYDGYVWDDAALDELEKNKDKYLQKIIAGSE